jgi:hypothetical protein
MIKVQINSSFPEWFQIFAFGKLIDEILGSANALEYSKNLAKHYNIKYICFEDKVLEVDSEVDVVT